MTRLIFGASVGWLGISVIADGVPALLLPYRLGRDGATDATTLGLVTLVAIGLAALIGAGALAEAALVLVASLAGALLHETAEEDRREHQSEYETGRNSILRAGQGSA